MFTILHALYFHFFHIKKDFFPHIYLKNLMYPMVGKQHDLILSISQLGSPNLEPGKRKVLALEHSSFAWILCIFFSTETGLFRSCLWPPCLQPLPFFLACHSVPSASSCFICRAALPTLQFCRLLLWLCMWHSPPTSTFALQVTGSVCSVLCYYISPAPGTGRCTQQVSNECWRSEPTTRGLKRET